MSADQTIIKAMVEHLPDRFFSILSDQANIKPNKKGYTLIGEGQHTKAYQKGEDILLFTLSDGTSPSKETGAILHALYPKNPHFPFLILLMSGSEDIYKSKKVDDVWYDQKKNIWYQAKGEREDISQWEIIKDKGALRQLEFIDTFLKHPNFYEPADPKIIPYVESLNVHRDVKSLQKAIIQYLTVAQSRKVSGDFDFGLYHPEEDGETWDFPKDKQHFEWLRNLAIDRKGKNVVLLDWID